MASPVKRESCGVSSELTDAIAREHWAEVKNILSASSRHVADSVVTQLINEDQWSAVRQILECVEDKDRTWNIGGIVVKGSILLSVAKRDWKCLKESPNKRFPDSTFQWIIRQASTQATESKVVQFVLPHCADDRLDSMLIILVERRQWQAVGQVLVRGVSNSMKQWAVRETCKHCQNEDCRRVHSRSSSYYQCYRWELVTVGQFFIQDILPHCADDQLDSVLTTLVERRLWDAVLYVLERGVSDSSKRWVVFEVCACCESVDTQDILSKIFHFCADDQVDCVLTTLVERRMWLTVGVILKKKSVSDSNKQWAVQEACKHCEGHGLEPLIQNILPHCADDQLDSVLTTMVERRLWRAVGVILKKKSVSDSNKQWAIQEACTKFKDDDLVTLIEYILPHGTVDQLDCVLTTLVERCQWWAVLYVLKCGVSDSKKQWAVQEACKHELEPLIQNILPHCAVDQLDSVLTTLVERRLWRAVMYVLKRGVSDFSTRWVVLEVCACCESGVQEQVLSDILLFCADDHADFVLTTLVERLQWRNRGEKLKLVVELLKQGVSETVGTRAVEETWKAASRHDFIKYVLPHCSLSHLNSVMANLVTQGEQTTVDIVMQRHRKEMETKSFVLPRWYVDVLPSFVELGLWNYVQEILHSVVKKSLYHWTEREGEINEEDSVLWAMVNTCRVNATCAVRLFRAVKENVPSKVRELQESFGFTEDLCELLYTSFLDQVCVELCSEEKKTDSMTKFIHDILLDIYKEITSCIQTISTNSVEGMVGHFKSEARKITSSGKLSSFSANLFLYFLKQLKFYYICERRNGDDEVLLMMFAVLPLSPVLQSVALRIMLRQERWDVISQADLSGVWEQDRRHLLQAAVKQRQWSVVKRWADHTLYDDQRVWALNEALNEKQWDVALLLADHGLTDIDLMRVHYRLAKYADWDVILHMFERGADVAEVKERLGRMKDNKRISEKSQRYINDRHSQVKALEKTNQNAKVDAWKNACRRCKWIFVLYALHRNPVKESVQYALKVAMKKKAWHIVMQLVRLGMDAEQRRLLFFQMKKRCQWGVCRVLLEQGLSVELCREVLSPLMKKNQWALVARVMEHDVGDGVRQQVMKRAWKRREGSVVWLCIKSLPTPPTREEREVLFQRAFSCELWQVIKPLVEEKDETGIRHRDTALLEAINLHEWDLVDHCQWHHADINMKDDHGHTPLQRAAMKKDWAAVEELVVRDGNPNLMDREGNTVLHRAIEAQQWGIVYLLIQYQADIHEQKKSQVGTKGVTPLGMLIDARRMDMIKHTLLWCPDQAKGANHVVETTLHVACLSGYHDSIYYLVARRVNPLAVTNMGRSALVYAVLNEDCPQRMVAECIKMGFSTHQPYLTNNKTDLKFLIPNNRREKTIWFPGSAVSSPFLCALLRGLPVVMQMLDESGACSLRELFRLYTELPKLADPNTDEGRQLQEPAIYRASSYNNFVSCIAYALPYLSRIATTPRRLESTCRLVISHCLTLSKTRHRDVDQLPLPERMKNFVLFSDLTDPDFGKVTT